MLFHLRGEDFKKFINDMSKNINIDADIIEKDYYVCTILKELAEKQEYLKAFSINARQVYF